MKISQVMEFMNVECIVKGDIDYNETLLFDNLNINVLDDSNITNNDFHAQAALCAAKLQKDNYGVVLQNHIDAMAREKQYENGFSCATYINSTNETWAQEAADFIAWRDACWQYAYDIQAQVEDGQINAPSVEDFINNAPDLVWSV